MAIPKYWEIAIVQGFLLLHLWNDYDIMQYSTKVQEVTKGTMNNEYSNDEMDNWTTQCDDGESQE